MHEPTTDVVSTQPGPSGERCGVIAPRHPHRTECLFTDVSPRGTRLFWD